MQIFKIPNSQSIVLCFVLWGSFQVIASIFSQKLPEKFLRYDNIVFRSKKFEKNGRLYKSLFKIHIWKKFLPDGAAIIKSGYRKRHLKDISKQNLNKFLLESCRAELSHFLAITPFWIFGFFLPPISIPIMFIYAIIINVPCILAQRYNRPRILKLYEKIKNSTV
jgi:glycosyl-4,4'-diaponeurosporenoate acyltransferase